MHADKDRYEILATVGEGTMGVVYKARDREIDEIIALKVLRPELSADRTVVSAFKRELKLARSINHPNIARPYHFFRWRDGFAIVEQYIEGESLAHILGPKPLPEERALPWLRYICAGLHTAHKNGVIHRDLKPSNILIDRRDRPHILDFGLAIRPGTLSERESQLRVGSAAYMSPEQAARPGAVDHRTDLYSLGALLYKMLTGWLLFPGLGWRDTVRAQVNRLPRRPREVNPGLSPALEDVIRRCLEKNPDHRYQSARELYIALEEAVGRGATESRVSGPGRRVLVVDDSPETRQLIRTMLEELAVDVAEAENGFQALKTAITAPPDLILLDIMMPVLDGRQALQLIKSNGKLCDVPVVVITELENKEEELMAKARGAALFLRKPIQEDVLALVVDRFLGPPA